MEGGHDVKCITVKNPWAAAIMLGLKDVENRTFKVRYKGPLLIHASRSFDRNAATHPRLGRHFHNSYVTDLAEQRGVILGFVELKDCQRIEDVQLEWAEGPVCWLLGRSMIFPEPIPYRGALGLYDVPDELVLEAIEQAVTPEAWIQRKQQEALQGASFELGYGD